MKERDSESSSGGSLLVSRRSCSIGVIYLIDLLRADLRVDIRYKTDVKRAGKISLCTL